MRRGTNNFKRGLQFDFRTSFPQRHALSSACLSFRTDISYWLLLIFAVEENICSKGIQSDNSGLQQRSQQRGNGKANGSFQI